MTARHLLCGLALGAAGCSPQHAPAPEGSRPPPVLRPIRITEGTVCPQTFEFGNYGCVDLVGRVRRADGAPAVGASVGAPDPAEGDSAARGAALGGGYPSVDATGRYRLRLTRYSPPAASQRTADADTLTVLIRAALPPGPEVPSGVPGPTVFARVRVTFRPVGQPARVYELPDLTLPER